MNQSAAYYVRRAEIPGDGLKKYNPFDVVICGGECNPGDIDDVTIKLPGKEIGAYAIASDLGEQERKGYPGPLARYVSTGDPFIRYGVGQPNPLHHVGMLSAETVEWTVEMVKRRIGPAKILVFDCWSPKNCDWRPGVDFNGDGKADTLEAVATNWREWTVKTVAALHAAFPDVYLVPNVGHGVNPATVKEPLRSLYKAFGEHANGVGVEGDALAPAQWGGTFRAPRRSFLFTNSLAGFEKALDAPKPSGVLPACRSWLLV